MDLQKELDFARNLGLDAGRIASGYFKSEYEVKEKGEDNPLTTADLEVNAHIEKAIKGEFPEDGWLSEETKDSPERLSKSRCWIIDPIDGTKEFIKGLPEFAISIALTVDGKPVLGVLHNPATGDLFYGAQGQGVFSGEGQEIRVAGFQEGHKPTLVASRTEISRGMFEEIGDHYELTPCGSVAFKLGLIAAGRYDVNISLAPKNEWDVAAGIALISNAGGVVTDLQGNPYKFNQKDPLNTGIVAGHQKYVDAYFRDYAKASS